MASSWGAKGDSHPGAKLSNAQAEEIKKLYAAGGVTQATLAKQYNVSQMTINHVLRGKTYGGSAQ